MAFIDFAKIVEMAKPNFDQAATTPIVVFELFVIAGSVAMFLVFRRFVEKLWARFAITAGGVLIFEMFTAPMWVNAHMGAWAYVYRDVSWILTVGWTALILGAVLLVDRLMPKSREAVRFAVSLAVLLLLVVPAETAVVQLGIRTYSPEVLEATCGVMFLGVPVEVFYYVPVFSTLVIAFSKYWGFVIDDVPLIPLNRRKWVRGFLLATTGVLLFELMIEPMVRNEKMPEWSYVYRDISLLMTAGWVALIAVAAVVVDRFLLHWPTALRFAAALGVMSVLALPYESALIVNGYRVYGESAVADFLGFNMPITGVPVEVAFAIPCYLALIIAFIRYWEIVQDNRL